MPGDGGRAHARNIERNGQFDSTPRIERGVAGMGLGQSIAVGIVETGIIHAGRDGIRSASQPERRHESAVTPPRFPTCTHPYPCATADA